MATYKFITKYNQEENTSSQQSYLSFYQIALHAHPQTHLHHIRKFIIDENDNIIKMSEYNIKHRYYEQLLKRKKNNEYKQYSVYNLSTVGYPQRGDILLLKSNILSVNNLYTGYAQF